MLGATRPAITFTKSWGGCWQSVNDKGGSERSVFFYYVKSKKRRGGSAAWRVLHHIKNLKSGRKPYVPLSLSLSFPPLLRILYPFTELRSFPYCRWMGYIVRGWTPSLSPFFFSLSFSQGNLKTHWLALHKSPAGDIDPLVWIAIGSMRECHQ